MDGWHSRSYRILGVPAQSTVVEALHYVVVSAGDHQAFIDVIEDYGEANPRTYQAALREADKRVRDAIQAERDRRARNRR